MLDLALEIHGSGDPILFIHGLGGTANVFMPQIGVLSRFFMCVCPDLPGAGRSPSSPSLSIDTLVTELLTIVDRPDISRPVHLIAHSMGTLIAQHLAIRAPQKVRTLSLIGPIHTPTENARQNLRARAATVRRDGMSSIADTIVQAGLSTNTHGHLPAVCAFVRELILRQNSQGYADHCEALAGAESPDLVKIAHPTLLLTGDEDNTAPAIVTSQWARKLFSHRLKILSRCGHWATLECPTQVSEILLEFLIGGGK